MAASIAKLNITLGADASGLGADINKSLTKAHAQMLRGGKQMGMALAAGVSAGVAGIAAIAGTVAGAFKEGVQQIDTLSAKASKLGMSTSGLAALEFAAKLADTSFEGLTTGVEKLQQNLALVSMGKGGAAADALQMLGLSAEELRKLKPEDQILAISEAFSKLTDQSSRMFVAKGLFGKGGAEMINLLSQGVDKIKLSFEEAEILGLRFSERQAEAVGKFDNATHKLRGAWTGFGIQLAAQIAPQLERFANLVVDIVKKMGGMENIVRVVVETLGIMTTGAARVAQQFMIWKETLDLAVAVAKMLFEEFKLGIALYKAEWDKLVVNIENGLKKTFTALVNEMIASITKTWNEAAINLNVGKAMIGQEPNIPIVPLTQLPEPKLKPEPGTQIDASLFGKATEAAEKEARDLVALRGEDWAKDWAEDWQAATAQSSQGIKKTGTEIQNLGELAEREAKKTAATAGKVGEAVAEKTEEAAKEMENAFSSVHARNQDLVLDMTMAWITGTGKWSDIIAQWAQQTIRQFLQVALFGRQVSAIGGGATTGGLISGAAGWIGKIAGAFFGGGKQGGGHVSAGMAYRVGEVGPEMFVPNDAGTIIPNRMMRGGGGGMMQPIIVNQQFAPGVQQSHIAVLLDQLRAESKAGVLAAVEEGGTFRRRLRA